LVVCTSDPDAIGDMIKDLATAIDNCDTEVEVAVKSVVIAETDPCMASDGDAATAGQTTATVIISATDDCGNVGEVSRTITLIRPNLTDHLVKVEDATRGCNDESNTSPVPSLMTGTMTGTEFTKTGTVALSETDYVCGYILQKRDVEIPGTDCGRKIYRYWSVVDWCTPGVGPSAIDTNFIEYTDTDAPAFASADMLPQHTEPLSPFACEFDVSELTVPSATDACDTDPTEYLAAVALMEDGGPWPLDQDEWGALKCGTYRLTWVASDDCHEQTVNDTVNQMLVIEDVTEPSAICKDELNVSVPTNEGARLHYSAIDAGSYDACGIAKYEIRKNGGAWGEYVNIECTDIKSDVTIELRVTDNKGNTNSCWMKVTAEDKIAPVCGSLPIQSLKCNEIHTGELGTATNGYVALEGDLLARYNARFGDPLAECSDNLTCAPFKSFVQEYSVVELNCGELDIDRRWRATDWADRASGWGTQHIDVDYEASWTLTFPSDADAECNFEDGGFPAAWTAEQIITNGSCDLWALDVTEKTFEVPGDICMKVERTYELINWCVYEAGTDAVSVPRTDGSSTSVSSAGNENVGRYTYVQILKLYTNQPPRLTISRDVNPDIVGVGDVAPYGMADNTPGVAPFECDEERTFSATATNCALVPLGSDNFTWKFYENGDLKDNGTGSSFTKVVSPKIDYKVEFWVSDGCGNSIGGDE